MCDESLFPDASPRFVIVFARARQPKVALLLMLASAKWAFCRCLVDKTKVSLTRDLCESSRLLETNDERAYAPPSRDWHLIGTIQFLSRRAFGPFDNLVALYLGIEHKGDPKRLDMKWQKSLFEIIWKDSMWKMIELVPYWINWLCNCMLHFVFLSLSMLLSLCLCLSIRNTSTYFLLCV